jgi:carbon storage regulator CsrA
MLVLSRWSGQDIVMTLPDGQRIIVKVFKIIGDKARIAIDAPGTVRVHRGEVQRMIDDGVSHAISGHDGPGDTDGTHEAAATDGHVLQVPQEGAS